MCGIMGYIGMQSAADVLLDGLDKLSYRGYDSAGLALHQGDRLRIIKTRGRVDLLRRKCKSCDSQGSLGLGHTRWATHGPANDINAHPHTDMRGRIAVVHNGVIENHAQLRAMLTARGYRFLSETDTECAAHLLDYLYDGDMCKALLRCAHYLQGTYALAVLCASDPSALYCLRSGSPLILGESEQASYLSSDIPALLPYTRQVFVLDDGEAAVLRRTGITVIGADGHVRRPKPYFVGWQKEDASLGDYPHYMLKEICEQPRALSIPPMTEGDAHAAPEQALLLGCGTAYHACELGAHYIESIARIPAAAEIASEYPTRMPFPYGNCACVAVSQSGETADTLSAARLSRERGAQLIALTNTPGSSLQRMTDYSLITLAGPELAVASTKAYTAQALSLLHLALQWGQQKGAVSREMLHTLQEQMENLPTWAEEMLSHKDALQQFIQPRAKKPLFFFIGRGVDAITAREAALKFKEITYIPAEAYPAGELKHGALALISEGLPVIAICTQPQFLRKTLISLSECRARGAECICFCLTNMEKEALEAADHVFTLPDMPPLIAPVISIIPLQLLSYYAACARGVDVDKPRNLAKSVTVE